MATPTSSLTVRKTLPCVPAEAFRAWTQPALFRQWFAPDPSMQTVAEVDLRTGGKYRIGFQPPGGKPTMFVGGEFLTIKAPHQLVYTWIWEKETDPDWKDRTVVRIDFNAVGTDQTEIVLTHEHFSDPGACESHTKGWSAIIGRMSGAMGDRAL